MRFDHPAAGCRGPRLASIAAFATCAWLSGCALAPRPAPSPSASPAPVSTTAPGSAPSDVPAGPALDAAQRALLATHVRPESFRGESSWATLRASSSPLALRVEPMDLDTQLGWTVDGQARTLAGYLARQPVTALLIAKDGRIVYEEAKSAHAAARADWRAREQAARDALERHGIARLDGELGRRELERRAVLDHLHHMRGARHSRGRSRRR